MRILTSYSRPLLYGPWKNKQTSSRVWRGDAILVSKRHGLERDDVVEELPQDWYTVGRNHAKPELFGKGILRYWREVEDEAWFVEVSSLEGLLSLIHAQYGGFAKLCQDEEGNWEIRGGI